MKINILSEVDINIKGEIIVLSVIMCVYNAEKFLLKAINSILSQTYDDFELLIIDDGSTDRSSIIALEVSNHDKRIKYIKIPNSGPANARNVGLNLALGEFVLFCDSDDELMPEMLEELYNSAKINNAQIVCCGYNMIVENKKSSHVKQFLFKDLIVVNKDELAELLPQLMQKQLMYVVWNKLYNLQFLKENNASLPIMSVGEDRYFNMNLLINVQRFCFVNKTLYNYKIHNTGITSGQFYDEKFIWISKINDIQIRLFEQLNILNEKNTLFLNYLYFRMIVSVFTQLFSKKCTLNVKAKKKYIYSIIKNKSVISACNNVANISIVNKIISIVILSGNISLIYFMIKSIVVIENLNNYLFILYKYK